ncbi:MAG: hypothetical protein ABI367_05735 [Mucilaginibacter sp.]
MKKKLILISGFMLIACISLLIYSCAKKLDDGVAGTTIVPDNLLQAAENWHSAQTQVSNTFSNEKKKYVLPPTWKEAKLQILDNGKSQIVVSGPEVPVDAQFGRGVIRKFVFTESNGQITDGKIIEMFSSKDSIDNRKENLIESYAKGNVGDFTGVAINYDVNYNRLSSDVYVHGVKQSGLQVVVKSITAKTFNSSKFAKNAKSTLGAPTTMMDINPNCWYLCYDVYGYDQYGNYGIVGYIPFYEYGCDGGSGDNNEAGGVNGSTLGGSGGPGGCSLAIGKNTVSCASTTHPLLLLGDPCNQLPSINALDINSIVAAQDNTILNYIASDPNHEWGTDVRVHTLADGTIINTSPTQGPDQNSFNPPQLTWDGPTFWDDVNGYTVGWTHSHPTDGPDMQDVIRPYTQVYRSDSPLFNASDSDKSYFESNTFMKWVTPDGTYLCTIADWSNYVSTLRNTYQGSAALLEADWRTYAQAFLLNAPSATNFDAAAYGVMKIFGSTINMFYKPWNAQNGGFMPLQTYIDPAYGEVIGQLPCY